MAIRDSKNGEAATLPIIDISQVPDGTYRGNHQIKEIDYEVEVTIASHRITKIQVNSGMQRVFVKKCALCEVNQLIWEIIEFQSVDVDAVSGATQTGIAIRHAVVDAMTPPYTPR